MLQTFSFHNHTYRCMHAEAELTEERVIREHAERGFTHVAVTDHCPWKDFGNAWPRRTRMLSEEKADYLEKVQRAKEKYAGKISAYSGFEVEYLPFLMDEIMEMRSEVDLMVLGQHFFYDPETQDVVHVFDRSRGRNAMENYAACIEKALEAGWPDIIAHPDIIMLQKDSWTPDAEEAAHRIFAAAAKAGVPVEINLCRVWHMVRENLSRIEYPWREFWQVAMQYDVKVLYGIDCHEINQLDVFEQSLKQVREVLGEDVISALNFCTAQDVLKRRGLL